MPRKGRAGFGDVDGETKTDLGYGSGESITVAKASFDPGYDVTFFNDDDLELEDIKRGFYKGGKAVGDASE